MTVLLYCLTNERNNLRVIVPARETLCADADGEDRHSVCRMPVRCPSEMGFFIEQRDAGVAEFVNRLIHGLRVFATPFASGFVERFQFRLFLCRDLYRVPESQVLAVDGLYLFPTRFLVVLEQL